MFHALTLPFPPVPKERARQGKNRRWYTPKRTLEFEREVRESYDGPMFSGPLYVDLDFSKDRTLVCIENIYGLSVQDFSPLRGDIDNYIKGLLDGLNGVAWEDDKQVTIIRAEKVI